MLRHNRLDRPVVILQPTLETTTAREHVESKDCWCHPTLDYVDPETGCEVWIHHKGN
jgi:hypothetical protein